MKSVANQAKSFRWANILNINHSNGITRSLLNNYGQLTTAEVKMHAQNSECRNVVSFLIRIIGQEFQSNHIAEEQTTIIR